MNDKVLLMSTRLKMPQPRKDYIIRKEIFSKLDKINEYNVTLVKGCAGAGKTTLITSFAKEKNISNFKWISLDEKCNNVFMFWNYFIEVTGEYLGEDRQDFLSLYDSNFQKSNLEQLLTLLINGLNNKEDIFIVLDDIYYVTDSFLIHTIDFFLRNVSDNVHLIMLTRYEPILYLGAINMEGKLLVIDEDDLKLSKGDGIRFLKDTLKLNLKPETLDFINDISEGWIGGLQLVAAATNGKSEMEIKNLRLENKLVGEYLTKEIYEFLDSEEKQFLVVTSMLSYFNEEICCKLLDKLNFKKIIDKLLKKNILIICIDEKNGIYRYHNILKEYLFERFKGLKKETQIGFSIKAAEVLEKLCDYNQCIDQLIEAEDYASAMKLILELPQSVALLSYVDKIPDIAITKNPDFAYQCFFYYYANMEFEKAKELYVVIDNNMSDDSTFPAFEFSNMFVEENFKINQIDVMTIEEIDKLPLKEATKAYILIKNAYFLLAQCKYDESLDCTEKAMSYSVSKSNPYIMFFAFSTKSQILEEKGEFNKCLAMYKDMNKILKSTESLFMLSASFYIGITGVYLKQLDLKNAKNYLISAAKYNSDLDNVSSSIDGGYRYNLAEYKFISGDAEGAMKLVHELLDCGMVYTNLVYIAPLLKYVLRINKFSGEFVERFIVDYESMEKINRSLDSKLLYANILFYQGKIQSAMEVTDDILKYSRLNKIKLKLVQASLFKIKMIYGVQGQKREIINLFREDIFYSYKDKILLPYYFESEIVTKVIKQYESDFYKDLSSEEKEHYKEIMRICKIETKAILSEREIDVINEISKGSSNKEISEHLFITLATVKSHIINIYSKLQVNNRVSAIEVAKKNKIL